MTNTATAHRHDCQRPGWQEDRSASIRHVVIARCKGCGAIELRLPTAAAGEAKAGGRHP